MVILKQVRKAVLLLIVLILAGCGGWWLRGVDLSRKQASLATGKKDVNFTLFWEVWDRLEKSYLDKEKLQPMDLYYGAIKGLVAGTGDPYSVFLPPKENQRAKEDLNGDFEGVGIQIGFKKGRMVVIAPLSQTPAEKAKVKAGDYILKIEDEKKGINQETTNLSLPEAVEMIRGPKGSTVFLTLFTEGDEDKRRVELVRATILVNSVETKIKDSVAYLKLSRFGDKTDDEWQTGVTTILKDCEKINGCSGLVLDLRNNPGGYLSGAVFVASEFLDSGVVVYQQDKENKQAYQVNRRGRLTKIPLVVLINEGSASASEIVAGALQVYKRAVLVGEDSFGKGTIQEAQELPGGAGLHITTARWLLPNEERLEGKGLKPDYPVKNPLDDEEKDLQLEKAMEIIKD